MTTDAIKAFVKAQSEMGKALKTTKNDHFKSRYADLSSVQEACFPALNANGFAVMQPSGYDEHGEYVETVFLHESGTDFRNRIYLKVGKPDMQGYGSAITYARRYGIMSLAGLAPEDDDGKAAAKYPPRSAPQRAPEPPHDPQTGEVYSERNPPPTGATEADSEDADAPSVKDFMDQVRERLAMEGNKAPSRDDLEHAYAMAVIENMAKRKSSARAKQWYDIFCDLHGPAIGRIQSQSLRMQVRSAIAFKGEQIAGKNPDPADFGFPFGHPDPIVLGDVQVTDDAGRPI